MKIMDPNDNEITSADEDDSFDKLDLSEIGVSTEMDMQTMVEKIKKLETDVLAIKTNGNGGQDGHSLIQLNFLIGEKFGEMKKEMDGMKKEMEELKEAIGMDKNAKALEELQTANDQKKEKEEEKKEIERLKAENAEKNRAYEELKETCEKLKAELAEIDMEKLLDQLNPINKDKMRLVFESLLRAVSDTKIYDQIEQKFDPIIKFGFINCLVQALSIHMNISLHQCDPTSNEKLRLVFESLRQAVSLNTKIEETFDPIIKLGFINCLVKALSIQDEKIQYEAAWALTNIATGNSAQTWAILDAKGIEPLLKMCTSKSNKLAEQALWAISNIARDSIKCRDEVIAGGVVPVLVELGKRMNNLNGTFVCIIAWCINILCYHKPLPSNDLLVQLVQPIASLLKYDDIECKIDTYKSIVYLTSGPKGNIALALDFIPDMVLFIKSASEEKLILLALQVLENFTMAEPNILADVCKRVKQSDIFEKLLVLKQHESKEIAKIADSILNKFFPNNDEKTADETGIKME